MLRLRLLPMTLPRLFAIALLASAACQQSPPVYQATGIKICEVDQDSAIIWTRLTRDVERVGSDHPMPSVKYRDPETGELEEASGRPDMVPVVEFPDGSTIETIEGAVPGAEGEVRVRFRLEGAKDWSATDWQRVDREADFTAQLPLTGLEPASRYELEVEARPAEGAEITATLAGGFKTAPAADEPARVVFTATTGTSYRDQDAPVGGFKMYAQMLELDPSFFVHTGDILYYDRLAKTLPLAHWHWQRMYSLPTNVAFHKEVSSYFIKDDHDAWRNDSWPTMQSRFMGDFTFEHGLRVFRQQVGMGEKTYRTIRWGKDLQVWLVEGRDFRSPNDMPDGPDKTIWGAEQKEWFKRTVAESDAAFRVLISPTPIVGPDRVNKNDNHANRGFTHEGDEIRGFIASQKDMYVVCGDRHWQYVSQHGETGVREYSTGPGSDAHAGGFSQDRRTDEHLYLNVIGGFLAGTVRTRRRRADAHLPALRRGTATCSTRTGWSQSSNQSGSSEAAEHLRASVAAARIVGLDEVALVVGRLLVHAALEVEQLDFAELDRVALALQRDAAAVEDLAVPFDPRVDRIDVPAADLRQLVLEHLLAVDQMHDPRRPQGQHLRRHPLLAVISLRGRRGAVAGEQLAVLDDMRAGRAEVRSRPLAFTQPAEQLHLDRDRKILVAEHGRDWLAVDHEAAVAARPAGAFRGLFPDEAVLGAQAVVGELALVEQVPEAVVELVVGVVGGADGAVLDAERVAEILADLVAANLGNPARKILAVEELNPLLPVGVGLRRQEAAGQDEKNE